MSSPVGEGEREGSREEGGRVWEGMEERRKEGREGESVRKDGGKKGGRGEREEEKGI